MFTHLYNAMTHLLLDSLLGDHLDHEHWVFLQTEAWAPIPEGQDGDGASAVTGRKPRGSSQSELAATQSNVPDGEPTVPAKEKKHREHKKHKHRPKERELKAPEGDNDGDNDGNNVTNIVTNNEGEP